MQPATGDFLPAAGASPSQAEIGLQPEVGTQVQRHHAHILPHHRHRDGGPTWQACQLVKVVQKGPKGTKMVNLSVFDH